MKTLTEKQFYNKISESWKLDIESMDADAIGKVFAFMLNATFIKVTSISIEPKDSDGHDIYLYVFHRPKIKYTHGQICEILDAGNHCVSSGTIIYEDDYAYITWSNLGHI